MTCAFRKSAWSSSGSSLAFQELHNLANTRGNILIFKGPGQGQRLAAIFLRYAQQALIARAPPV
jgi:hypothetical protein